MAGLTLLNDIIFKIVFGTEANRALLRALLNALLGLTGSDRIIDLTILNPLIDKEYLIDKDGILDVRARDGARRQYNIEVQLTSTRAYLERVVFYLSRLYVSQLEKGQPYSRLARTIGISLTDFVIFPDLEDLHTRFRFHDEAHGIELTDLLELHVIELAKFREDRPKELRSPFEKWLHVLKFGEIYEDRDRPLPADLGDEEGIAMAVEAMRQASASEQVREMIEFRRKAEHDEATRLESARLDGLEEGLEKGLEKGREEGREEGQRLASKEMARKMRDAGVDPGTIRQITGMDLDEID